MSTTVDQRVVEMRFDNKHFESNVSTTLSTLDKLKQRLNLTGASKGLENVGAAAKNVNMAGLGSAVETVQAKFSALQVVGVTALSNITNSAVNAGKRMISALTIDPVKTGFSEYETKINSIQTIMSNTASKGTTMEDVTRVIDELNTYADKTIYNFAEMTRNIGTFTAAGVGLEESAAAIQGIANLAAASGSTSQQASTAMYQLSQALAAGTVKLMDWNSVVNAGMGGEKFQEALKATAREHGIAVDQMIEENGSFRDSLQEGWISADILNETLRKFTVEGATEYANAMVASGKYTKEQADALIEEAQSMEDAATKVKTFTQLWDTLKESAQSGWSKTWELIIGDFDDAKDLFTSLSDTLGGFINRMSDFRNNLIEGALDLATPWTKIMDKLDKAGLGKIKEVAEDVSAATDKLKTFQEVVNNVWRGDYGNSDTGRFELLEKAGYDHRVVQDLVNKGHQYKLTTEDIEASHKKFGLTMDGNAESASSATSALGKLSDEQLRNAGLTEDEIKLYRDLAEEAERTGVSIEDLIDKMSKNDGRTLLIDSFKNAGSGLIGVFTALKNAWIEIFPPMSVVQLYGIIEAINKFSENLRLTDEKTGELTGTAEKLQRTFEGVFAVIDIIATVAGGTFKVAFQVLTEVLGYFDMDILDLTASIGDALVKFRDWVDASLDVTKVLDEIVPVIKKAIDATKEWFEGLKEADNIPKYIIEGLVKGLVEGVKAVGTAALNIGKSIVETIKNFLGIHSPSVVFIAIGAAIIAGLVVGMTNSSSSVVTTIQNIGVLIWDSAVALVTKLLDFIKNIEIGQVIAAGITIGGILIVKQIADVAKMVAAPLEGLGAMFEGLGDMFEGLGAKFKADAWKKKSQAFLNMAIAIGILAASVAVLAQLETGKLWGAVGAIAVLGAVMIGLMAISSKMDKVKDIGKPSLSLIAITGSLLILAIAVKQLSGIQGENLLSTVILFAEMIGGLVALVATIGASVKGKAAKNIDNVGAMMLKISAAMLIMTIVMKQISGMSGDDIGKGLSVMAGFELLILGIVAISKLAGKNSDKAGSMLLKMSVAMLIMVAVVKLCSMLDEEEVGKGILVIASIEILFAAIIAVSKLAGQNGAKAGTMLLLMSAAMLIMVGVIKGIADINPDDVSKGLKVIGTIEILFAAIIVVSKLAGDNAVKAGTMLLLMSGAILVLVGAIAILSVLDPDGVKRGLIVVSVLEALFGGLMAITKLVNEKVKSTLITLGVVVALLVAAVVGLTFLDEDDVLKATGAISAIMGTFALLVAACGLVKKPEGLMKPLLTITLVIGLLAGILAAMVALEVEPSIETAGALAILMGTLSACLLLLSVVKTNAMAGIGALALLVLVVGELGVMLHLFDVMDVNLSMERIQALSVLMATLSACLVVIAAAGSIPGVYGGTGAMALLVLIVGELGVMLHLIEVMEVDLAMDRIEALSTLMASLSACLVLIAVAGTIPGVFAGLGALELLIVGLTATLAGLGAIQEHLFDLEHFLDVGIPILEKVGTALGSFFSSIASGFTAGLPNIADDLSQFMDKLGPFIEGAKSIDSEVIGGVKNIAEVVALLAAANVIDGLTKLFGGGTSSLDEFGKKLPQLGTDLKNFADNLGTFDDTKRASIACAAETIKDLANAAKAIPNDGGLWGKIFGENSIATFAGNLPDIATAINGFAGNLGTFTKDHRESISTAVGVITDMANAAKEIPNDGGLWGKIFGENSIATFADNLPDIATAINGFASNLGTFTKDHRESISTAVGVITDMAKAADGIPNEGGVWATLFGDNSIATFADNLPDVATAISSFANNLGTFTSDQKNSIGVAVSTIADMAKAAEGIDTQTEFGKALFGDNSIAGFTENFGKIGSNLNSFASNLGEFTPGQRASISVAVGAIADMAKAAEGIDGQSDWAAKMFGDNSIAAFSEKLPDVGTNLNKFAENIGTFDTTCVNTAVYAIASFTDMGKIDLKKLMNNIDDVGSGMIDFAKDLEDFHTKMPSSTSINVACGIARSVISIVKEVSLVTPSKLTEFVNALKTLSKDSLKGFIEGFSGETAQADLKSAGETMLKKVIEGISSYEESTKLTITTIIGNITGKIRDHYTWFYSAGSYVMSGFAAGIAGNSQAAVNAADTVAATVEKRISDALLIKSPSRVTMRLGAYVSEGLAIGIASGKRDVANASDSIAGSAMNSIKRTVSRISDAISADMDVQPTISPVLDLSNVRSGARLIGGIIGDESAFGIPANARAINSMMGQRSQNGDAAEVVSAINKLRKDLGSVRGDTYQIGDITYDDGSNISEAVKSIVRAARRERRT